MKNFKDSLGRPPGEFWRALNEEIMIVEQVAEAFDRRENRTGTNAPTFQFMRLGYFCMDNRDCRADHLVFNRSVSLKDSFKK